MKAPVTTNLAGGSCERGGKPASKQISENSDRESLPQTPANFIFGRRADRDAGGLSAVRATIAPSVNGAFNNNGVRILFRTFSGAGAIMISARQRSAEVFAWHRAVISNRTWDELVMKWIPKPETLKR